MQLIYYIYVFFVATIGRRRYISDIFVSFFPPTRLLVSEEQIIRRGSGEETKRSSWQQLGQTRTVGSDRREIKRRRYFCASSLFLHTLAKEESVRNPISLLHSPSVLLRNNQECKTSFDGFFKVIILIVCKKAFALASTSFMSQVLALAKIETEVKYTGGVEQIPFKGSFKFEKILNTGTCPEPDE